MSWTDIATSWQSIASDRIALPNIENHEQWKSLIKGFGIEEVLKIHPDFFEQDSENKEKSIHSLSNHLSYSPQLIIEGEKAVINWIPTPLMTLDAVLGVLEVELRSYLRWYFLSVKKFSYLGNRADN